MTKKIKAAEVIATKITVTATENPKRAGSASHTRFMLYRNGMMVEEYVAAGGRRADILWDMWRGFISLA